MSFSPGASSGSWTQTLGLGMARQVFYHCAATGDLVLVILEVKVVFPSMVSSVQIER
jgi:hypothetical protein